MAYSIDWIVPALRKPTHLWRLASTLTVVAVGLFSKVLISKFYFFYMPSSTPFNAPTRFSNFIFFSFTL